MRIALVGCGYVADFYATTLRNYPELEVMGVADRDAERAQRFARFFGFNVYADLAELLADTRVQIVVNLTNPRSHYAVSSAALEAGKHVYSEKPLATDWADAVALVDQAEARGLRLSSAPATLLGETAQTLFRLVDEGAIGKVRLAYAELDDGLVHRENYRAWRTASGSPWPFKDEFEVGCTLEHAGYYLTWLLAMFGPAESVTSFASCQVPEKSPDVTLDPPDTPDFSVGCIQFASGVVARLTNSIVATRDHSIRVFGDNGVLRVPRAWDFASPVYLTRWTRWSRRAERYPLLARVVGLGERRQPLAQKAKFEYKTPGSNRIDFARGIGELASSIAENRPSRLSPQFSLHVTETILALQDPEGMGSPRRLATTFQPLTPMPWATR